MEQSASASLSGDDPQKLAAAHSLVGHVVLRVRQENAGAAERGLSPEDVANEQNYYLDGWIDGVLSLSRDRLPSLSVEIEDALCGAQSDAEVITLSRLAARVPELATSTGLGCVLEQREVEDAVLAAALDAYRAARLPPSPAWDSWRIRATTPQIQRRFLPRGTEPPERMTGTGL